jgi:hypothetical protein
VVSPSWLGHPAPGQPCRRDHGMRSAWSGKKKATVVRDESGSQIPG